MKKKIAIIFNRMIVGGAEMALINMVHAIDREKYELTVFTYDETSAYLNRLPPEVTVQFTKSSPSDCSLSYYLKRGQFLRFLNGLYCRVAMRLCTDQYRRFEYNIRCLPKFREQYDCAISYKMNYEDTSTTLWRIRALKKCVVVHSDVGLPDNQPSCYIKNAANKFHRVFCVSDLLCQAVQSITPENAHKIQVLHNIVPVQTIKHKSNASITEELQPLSIVTLGRLSPEKGQNMVPKTVRILLNQGYEIHWYLIGDGPLRDDIEQEIIKQQVDDYVHLLGTKSNPYPYIKNCDIYVQTSYSEGYCTTTIEAKVLEKPIVTTDAPGMREQFISGENGLIVNAMTPNSIADGIAALINHPNLQEKFRNNLRICSYDNRTELQKLYTFIEM